MAIQRRMNWYSGQRCDIPNIRSLESSVANDFDMALRGLVTGLNNPYVIRGFAINGYGTSVPASSLTLTVADAAILHSSAAESGTILMIPATENDVTLSASDYVSGAFQPSVVNYVGLELIRTVDASTVDQTSGWSESQKREYQRTVPIGLILKYRVVINSSGFGSNLPLYVIKTNSTGGVEYITDARTKLFRLGAGGAVPNPQYNFAFHNLLNSQTGTRREWVNTSGYNPATVEPGDDADAFLYGDNCISSLKEWMDAIMTRIKEVTGSPYWYADITSTGKSYKLADVWWDACGNAMTGNGYLSYNMILESTRVTKGAFQSKVTDSEILTGDSYVVGRTAGEKANVNSFSGNQLVVNSLTSTSWTALEPLWNRRIYRPDLSKYVVQSYADETLTYSILSVSRVGYTVTVQTSAPHLLNENDYIRIQGTGINGIDGSHIVGTVTAGDTFEFTSAVSGTDSAVTGTVDDLGFRWGTVSRDDAAVASEAVTSWTVSGKEITLISTGAIPAGIEVGSLVKFTGLGVSGVGSAYAPNGVWEIKEISGTTMKFDVAKTPIGTPSAGGSYVLAADQTKLPYVPSFAVTAWSFVGTTITVTAPGHYFLTAGDKITVSGLGFSGAGSDAPNGTYTITNVTGSLDLQFTAATTPTGTPAAGGSVSPGDYTFDVTISGVTPNDYNVIDVEAVCAGKAGFAYKIGSGALPAFADGTGAPVVDGVIAYTSVADPVRIDTVHKVDNYNLLITTMTAHNFGTTAGGGNYTIYGDSSITPFVRYYDNVQILNIGTYQYQIVYTGSSLNPYADLPATDYVNSGSESVFSRSPNNPYPGPVQWDSDLILKSVIGDKFYKIPVTATATGTSGCNRFNTSGLTGTAYLQDGEVAYIELERNESLSSGASYSTTGGSAQVTGVAPLDKSSNPLVIGDYVKFSDETDGYWYKISDSSTYVPANEGNAITTSGFYLFTDQNVAPTSTQRPAKTGEMLYCKAKYDEVSVAPHWQVPQNPDLYWIAVRRDNGSTKSRVYLKALELEQGEYRQINDNEPSALLAYTGAGNEANTIPNYTLSASGSYAATESLTLDSADVKTRSLTFSTGPELGFQIGDKIVKNVGGVQTTFTVKNIVSGRSIIVAEDVSPLSSGDTLTYMRGSYVVNDSDNLTVGIRKEDRELAKVNSALSKTVYNESVYIQKMDFTGAGDIASGSYVYQGNEDAPTALAWVLHGTASTTESIEGISVTMPGGHSSVGGNAALVHIVSGTFVVGAIYQNGAATGRSFSALTSSIVKGGLSNNGVELVLPPNRRTQQVGSSYVVWPSHAVYKASTASELTGEELLVISNDTIREAGVDYSETFGGPKAKIKIIRDMPANTRIRFRVLSAYGSAIVSRAGSVTLQSAYDNSPSTIGTATSRPIEVYPASAPLTEIVTKYSGVVQMDGGGDASTATAPVGGIMGRVDGAYSIGRESNRVYETWQQISATKTHNSFTGSASITKTAAMVASNAAGEIVTSASILVPVSTVARVNMSFVARKQDNAGSASFRIEGMFRRGSTGDVNAIGSPTTTIIGYDGEGSAYAVTLSRTQSLGIGDYDQITPIVYGNGSSVNWACTIEYQMIGDTV